MYLIHVIGFGAWLSSPLIINAHCSLLIDYQALVCFFAFEFDNWEWGARRKTLHTVRISFWPHICLYI